MLLPILLAVAADPPAVPPAPPAIVLTRDGREPTDLPAGSLELSENSLPEDAIKNAAERVDPRAPVRGGTGVGTGVTYLRDTKESASKGIRHLRAVVRPGERIEARVLGAAPDKVFLRFWNPPKGDPFAAQFLRWNQMGRNVAQVLEFKNTLGSDYHLVLVLEGFAGYPYRLKLTRKGP